MEVIITPNPETASRTAARVVSSLVRAKPDAVLGLATGSTPLMLYRELVRMHREDGLDFSGVTTFNLDEYVGLGGDHPQSYHAFMWENLFGHINVPRGTVHIPDGMTDDIPAYCEPMSKPSGTPEASICRCSGSAPTATSGSTNQRPLCLADPDQDPDPADGGRQRAVLRGRRGQGAAPLHHHGDRHHHGRAAYDAAGLRVGESESHRRRGGRAGHVHGTCLDPPASSPRHGIRGRGRGGTPETGGLLPMGLCQQARLADPLPERAAKWPPTSPRYEEDPLRGPGIRQPAGLQVLQPAHEGRRQDHGAAPQVRRRPTGTPSRAPAPTPSAARGVRPPLGPGRRPHGHRATRPWTRRSSSSPSSACKYWCFHDRDIAPEGDTITETNREPGRRS